PRRRRPRHRRGAGREAAVGLRLVTAVRIRRAEVEDVDFLVELAASEEVEPFLGPTNDRDVVAADVDRSREEPAEYGRYVIEVEEGYEWRRAGTLGFRVASRHSRIA